MDELVSDFVIEAVDALAGLQSGVARLSLSHDAEAAADMLRRLHALKGLCGFVGLPRAEAVAHAAEGLLTVVAERPDIPDSVTLGMISDMIARLGELLGEAVLRRAKAEGDDHDLITALEQTVAQLHATPHRADRPGPTFRSASPGDRRTRAPWCGLDTLARALGDQLGKRIDLVVGGDDVRIAMSAAPGVRTALIALVRNACDHGVETPAERRAGGKPPQSLLHVAVRRTDTGVAVDFADDGRGIDPQKLRDRAVAQGQMAACAAASLSDHDAQDLAFAPGLSTAESLTPLSGRGLGLELVRREMRALGGEVEMCSTPGRGCRFTLLLPKSALAAPHARRQAAA
jgi:two-component system chemotaxis sensor kinase CheA